MFSDAIIYNNTYKEGLRLSSLGVTLLKESSIDYLPKLTVNTAKILGRPGSLQSGVKYEQRNIFLAIHLSPEMLSLVSPFRDYSVDELTSFLDQLLINGFEDYEITFPELPDRWYKVSLADQDIPKFYLSDATIGYTLVCYDPYAYGPYIELAPDTADRVYTNDGSITMYPQIQLFGPFTGVNFDFHGRTGTLDKSIEATESVIVDSLERTITLSTGANYRRFFSGILPEFRVGTTTEYSVTEATTGNPLSHVLRCRMRYLY